MTMRVICARIMKPTKPPSRRPSMGRSLRRRSGKACPGTTALPSSSRPRTLSAESTGTSSLLPPSLDRERMLGRPRLTLLQRCVEFLKVSFLDTYAFDRSKLTDFFRFGVKFVEELYAQQPSKNSAGSWKYVTLSAFDCSKLIDQSTAAQNTVPSRASSSQSPRSTSQQLAEISPEVRSHL